MNLVSVKATRWLSTCVMAGMVLFAATLVNTHAASTDTDPSSRTAIPGTSSEIQLDVFRGVRVLDERGGDVSAMVRVEATSGPGVSVRLRVAVDPRVGPGRYRIELVPARPEVAPVFVVVVVDRMGRASVPAEPPVPVGAPGPVSPVAVLDVPASVQPGTAFELSGQGSSAAPPGTLVRWVFTRVSGPGGSESMPVNQPVVTEQPRFMVAGGLMPGLHTFRLEVVDDSGNQSAPVEATVRVVDSLSPAAVLDVPASVQSGTAFELSGQGSSAAPPGTLVRWVFTRVSGPGGSESMPVNQPVVTEQPRLTVAGGLMPGLHTFRLVVVDDSGNQSAPVEAAVRVEEASATRTRAVDWSGTVLIPGNDAPVGSELVIRPPAGARLPRVAVSLAGQNLRLVSASPREVRVQLPARPLSGPLTMTNVDARASGLLVREYRVVAAIAERTTRETPVPRQRAEAGSDCSDPACICRGASDATIGLDAEEQAFLQIINNHRVQNRLGTVRACTSLNRAAQGHSEDMRDQNYLSHVSLDGRSPGVRACEACYERGCHSGVGENIAAGSAGAQATFDQWRSSPEHNANMLNGSYTVIGIGRATGGGQYGVYWTVKFGAQDEPSCN
ncbi:MAG: CAP domain-containing protein [Gammaproteobacteria bacterium]|nr:CAP domain-containing protein [Gammaproteobacteria bacterium]